MAGQIEYRNKLQSARTRLSELIEYKMDELQLASVQEFADRFGIGRSTLYELLRGRSEARGTTAKPSFDTMIALARALNRPLHEIVYLIAPDAPGADDPFGPTASLPLMKVRLNVAGRCEHMPNLPRLKEHEVWVDESFARGRNLQAFVICGDSMMAGKSPIHHGDIVLVNTGDKGYNTASVVARLNDGSYVCKMLKDDKFGKLLQSRNPEHTNGTPSAISFDQVEDIIGRVIRIIHDDDPI